MCRLPIRLSSAAGLVLLALFCVAGASNASTIEVIGTSGANGVHGDDGNPGGDGTDGAPGGDAVAVAGTPGDSFNYARATGGFGGLGGLGGDGIVPEGESGPAVGGSGGTGGAGGNGSATATTVVTVGDAEARAYAFGGPGGSGGYSGAPYEPGQPVAWATPGVSGDAVASATASAPGDVRISVRAAGGYSAYVEPGDPGVAGARASLGTVFGTSTAGGKVDIVGYVTGGDGSGTTGAGASVDLENAIDGATSGYLSLYQIAEAGHTEGIDATPGDARSVITKSASMDTLQITTEATGGIGPRSGSATAIAVAENLAGAAVADARAAGDDADATAVARGGPDAFVEALARAGSGLSFMDVGGNASSLAQATGQGSSYTYSDSIATGGPGSVTGGDATATAILEAGQGGGSSNVFARGGVGSGATPDGMATARSTMHVSGLTTSAFATTRADGGSGSAATEIAISGGPLTAGNVVVYAPVAGDGTSRVNAYTLASATLAGVGTSHQSPAFADGYQAVTQAAILPAAGLVENAIAGNATVEAVLDPTSPALLYAILGGGYAANGTGVSATFTNSIELSFDTTQLPAGDTLLLAFLNPLLEGSGFDLLQFRVNREGATVFDQTFTDAAAAMALFDDHVVDLGDWRVGLKGDLDLQFIVEITASQPGDAFQFNLVATTVPAPASVWLLLTAVLSLVSAGRKAKFP